MSLHHLSDGRIHVARLANLPNEVITVANEKSRRMEEETKLREMKRWNEKARQLTRKEVDLESIRELVKRLER